MANFAILSALGGLGAGAAGTKQGRRALFGREGGFDRPQETLSPEQKDLRDRILQLTGGATGGAFDYINQILSGDPAAFEAFEKPYKQQFEREIVPGIAERLGGSAGSAGALSSSSLNRSVAQAGTDLSTNLAALRSNLKDQAISRLQGYTGTGLAPTQQFAFRQPTGGFLGGTAQGGGAAGILALLKALGIGV